MGAVSDLYLSCADWQVHRSAKVHWFFLEFQETEATAIRETGKPAERRMVADRMDWWWHCDRQLKPDPAALFVPITRRLFAGWRV